MKRNDFFKPTLLYKEYILLELIDKNPKTTQREMSKAIGMSVAMANHYLDTYENLGFLKRKYQSTKMVDYFITKKGKERIKVLNIGYLSSAQNLYNSAKNNILIFLNQIIDKGFRKILLYGAGEVAEIMLGVINYDKSVPLEVVAVIDDDVTKMGTSLVDTKIISLKDIDQYEYDGILISSYKHQANIKKNLENISYPKTKILEFFN